MMDNEIPIEVIEKIKLQINNLIWMHSPKNTTLEEAEDKAIKILDLITGADNYEKI